MNFTSEIFIKKISFVITVPTNSVSKIVKLIVEVGIIWYKIINVSLVNLFKLKLFFDLKNFPR